MKYSRFLYTFFSENSKLSIILNVYTRKWLLTYDLYRLRQGRLQTDPKIFCDYAKISLPPTSMLKSVKRNNTTLKSIRIDWMLHNVDFGGRGMKKGCQLKKIGFFQGVNLQHLAYEISNFSKVFLPKRPTRFLISYRVFQRFLMSDFFYKSQIFWFWLFWIVTAPTWFVECWQTSPMLFAREGSGGLYLEKSPFSKQNKNTRHSA